MIRIDEIYNNTFWPWIETNLPQTRMFYCASPGDARPDVLSNFGNQSSELHYIFFHDQEPIYLDIHRDLFTSVCLRNLDLDFNWGPSTASIVTSEYDSENVQKICDVYGWKSFYYFFHGWAALDWFRGYNHTFLMPQPNQRRITHSFISANRIIGGRREHRILLMYHLLNKGVKNALISFPRICPYEHKDISDLSAKFGEDIQNVFLNADLPWCFPGEADHPMHSCWLSLFKENASSLAHVITETVYSGRRQHLTEKTFKPICLQMPFVMVSTAGSLDYLRRYGFRTFAHIWNEDYDLESDDSIRLEKISNLLMDLDNQSPRELQKIYQASMSVLEHNYNHFYGGDFEKILWQELVQMFTAIKDHVRAD